MERNINEGTIIALNAAGYSKKRIAEILELPVVVVRRALQGRASLSVTRERQEQDEPLETYTVAAQGGPRNRIPIPYADDTETPHGPVKQLMRDGKKCNDIVWSPKQ